MHTITISPDGGLHALQKKSGLDMRKLGPMQIVRVSEIVWQEREQAWAVVFKQGPYAGRPLTHDDARKALPAQTGRWGQGLALYDDYDAAVALEVAVVEAAQRRGETWWRASA